MHTQYFIYISIGTFGFFYRDNAVLGYTLHRISDQGTNFFVVVGRNSRYLFDFFEIVADLLRLLLQVFNHLANSFIHTALQVHWVGTCSNVFQTRADHGLCQNGSRCRTITCNVCSFGRNFLDHLSAHVFNGVFQFNFFGYGHTILGDLRRTKAFLDNHVTAFGSEGYFHGISQSIYPCAQFFACIAIEANFLSHIAFEFKMSKKGMLKRDAMSGV